MFNKTSVDSIVSDINKKVAELKKLSEQKELQAVQFDIEANEIFAKSAAHREESVRADHLAKRFEELIS